MRNQLSYYSYFNLSHYYNPNIKSALMIGGGGYTYASYLMENYPQLELDVVEIDPELLEISKKYFKLTSSNKFNNFSQDGRDYLNKNKKKYDVIFLDAYRNGSAIPFQLSTKEAYKKIFDSLSDNGLLFVNIISSLNGSQSDLFKAQYKTIESVFSNVTTFSIQSDDPLEVQNIVLMSHRGALDITKIQDSNNDKRLETFSKNIAKVEKYTQKGLILTDDYSPVEYFDIGGSL